MADPFFCEPMSADDDMFLCSDIKNKTVERLVRDRSAVRQAALGGDRDHHHGPRRGPALSPFGSGDSDCHRAAECGQSVGNRRCCRHSLAVLLFFAVLAEIRPHVWIALHVRPTLLAKKARFTATKRAHCESPGVMEMYVAVAETAAPTP